MTSEELALYCHRMKFDSECSKKTGMDFQHFFESIMEKSREDFVCIKPAGRLGDGKSDGYLFCAGTVFQCYAPEGFTTKKTVAKIMEDFTGALEDWGPRMKEWIFVYSHHHALPAEVVKVLVDLKTENPSVRIDQWGRERLWREVSDLPLPDRQDILGVVPELATITETSSVEIETLLNYLVRQPLVEGTDDLHLTDLQDKIARNGLGKAAQNLIQVECRQHAKSRNTPRVIRTLSSHQ
ncbi:hypothetical protein ACFL2Q_07150 [Thermodesulfobacteriota bacterium]